MQKREILVLVCFITSHTSRIPSLLLVLLRPELFEEHTTGE